MFAALFVLYVTTGLDVPPSLLGVVLATGAIGGALGSMMTRRLAARVGIGPAFTLGCLLFAGPLMLVPAATGARPEVVGLLLLAMFASGVGVMILDITIGSVFAAVIPDPLRARVTGAYLTVNYGVRPIGSLAAGSLGTTVGVRTTLWGATAGMLLGVLWLLPSPLLRMRALPSGEMAMAKAGQ
jgi:MFS family permease